MQSNSGTMTESLPGLPSGPQTGLPSLSEARAAGERGMTLAAEKANRQVDGWTTIAYDFLKSYAAREQQFTGFIVVAASKLDKTFPQPEKGDKAWGVVFRRALNEGLIFKTGRRVPHPKRHGCPADVYETVA